MGYFKNYSQKFSLSINQVVDIGVLVISVEDWALNDSESG